MSMRLIVILNQLVVYASALVIRIHPLSPDQLLSKILLLPVQIPRLLQDPQNIPRNNNQYFGFAQNGTLHVDLTVIRPLQIGSSTESASLPLHFTNQITADLDVFSRSAVRKRMEVIWVSSKKRFIGGVRSVKHFLESGIAASWYFRMTSERRVAAYTALVAPDKKRGARAIWMKQGMESKWSEHTADTRRLYEESNTTFDDYMYFFLLTENQWDNLLEDIGSESTDKSVYHTPRLFSSYIQSTLRVPFVKSSGQETLRLTFKPRLPSNYLLLILNPTATPLQLHGTITMTNSGDDHLSFADRRDGFAVKVAFYLNFVTACVVSLLLLTVWRENKTDLHVLAALTFIVKSLYLLLDWTNIDSFKTRGELETINWILPRMVAKIQDIVVLLLFILVGFGWKIARRSLTVLETRTIAATCVLSFYLGVFEASTGAFQAFRYIIHSLAFLVVIVAINLNIALLGAHLAEVGLCRHTAETYKKRDAYLTFRVVFIVFILKPTLLLLYKLIVLADTDIEDWILVIVDNLIDWAILVTITYAFRPFDNMKLFEDLGITSYHSQNDHQTGEEEDVGQGILE